MRNIETDYHKRQDAELKVEQNRSIQSVSGSLALIAMIICAVSLVSNLKAYFMPPPQDELRPVKRRYTAIKVDTKVQYLLDNPNKVENIPLVIQVLQEQGVRDLNRDGQVNCIDYSITFRMLYGSNARIMINNNPRTGMNHMFIRVHEPYSVIDVEPQGNIDMYSMGLVWGMRYEPHLSIDVTSQWGL